MARPASTLKDGYSTNQILISQIFLTIWPVYRWVHEHIAIAAIKGCTFYLRPSPITPIHLTSWRIKDYGTATDCQYKQMLETHVPTRLLETWGAFLLCRQASLDTGIYEFHETTWSLDESGSLSIEKHQHRGKDKKDRIGKDFNLLNRH